MRSAAYGINQETMPGALAFGDDGGSECLVFDARLQRPDGLYPVYAVNFVSIGWQDATWIAAGFLELLQLQTNLLHQE